MSTKVFQDKRFPRHVSDLMNLMHMVVFTGSDGEETWTTWLSLKQKEYAATALAQYYQCEHCIEFHHNSLTKLETVSILSAQGVDARAAIGELEAVIIFMKAAVSKNRVVDKIDQLFQQATP